MISPWHHDKAGAYGIQDDADIFVERIDGHLDTVIGLPLERIIQGFPELLEP